MISLQQYNSASQTSCFKMSDFVANFDLMVHLHLDEWWKETNRMEEEEKKENRLKSWKSQETKLGVLNRCCGQFAIFRPGVPRKIWLLTLNQSPKWSRTSLSVSFMPLRNTGKANPVVSAVILAYMWDLTGTSMYTTDQPFLVSDERSCIYQAITFSLE